MISCIFFLCEKLRGASEIKTMKFCSFLFTSLCLIYEIVPLICPAFSFSLIATEIYVTLCSVRFDGNYFSKVDILECTLAIYAN